MNHIPAPRPRVLAGLLADQPDAQGPVSARVEWLLAVADVLTDEPISDEAERLAGQARDHAMRLTESAIDVVAGAPAVVS